ncbi:hypothetical protein KBI52_17635 [Microvirga sp. HBU67558]|uniref:hypothetical protein n=1 Tax=Microvirga TaxID=186650 RepID=UPI001B38FE10|nr:MULTISPECIES: hypothetical protein [unclassified Microvirga]MBQ0822017.1 hypothetical protein [Microvirga sp. HBU67558]
MNRILFAIGALAASALLFPADAFAQRFGSHGGGFRGGGFGGGGLGGSGAFRGGGFGGGGFGGSRMFIPRGGMGGFGGGAIAGPRLGRGDFRVGAIGRPGYGFRAPYYGRVAGGYRPYYRGYYGGYPYYRNYYRGYPYYGGVVAAGLALGALSYPYYGYGYDYPYYGYYPAAVAEGEDCYWVRRRIVGPYGRIVIRRQQVCNY